MKHVSAIKKLLDDGQIREAEDALGNLLELGPNNIEALKLKANILRTEGKFSEEVEVWTKIFKVDREDKDALSFFYHQQLEDREHFYFTDPIPGGGRRYIAYPRNLVSSSIMGLIGCIAFLMISRLGHQYQVLTQSSVLLTLFSILVLLPWLLILFSYFRSIKSVTTSTDSIEIATRFRRFLYKWLDLESIFIVHSKGPSQGDLSLMLIPKANLLPVIELDINENSSAIRARSYLIKEISWLAPGISYKNRKDLNLDGKKILKF